jgi:hypothetical protein
MRRSITALLLLCTIVVLTPRPVAAEPMDRVDALGSAVDAGAPAVEPGHKPVGIARAAGGGYWIATDDGGVQTFGGAPFNGSAAGGRLASPIVGIAADPSGSGYWLAAADGGVFSFGAAPFKGSLGSLKLKAAIVGIAATPDGQGYWLAASDGGVFSFGSATYAGSMGGTRLAAPVVGIAAAPHGGYWLVASDGGVFAFGGAPFLGSAGNIPLQSPISSIASTPSGEGYWLAARDGGVFTYGDAPFNGSATGTGEPVTDMAANGASGYWLLRAPQPDFPPLPPGSGSGRRIVYSNPMQRVWLVEANGTVVRSYLVSGKYQTPAAGTYSVYSKSPHAYAGHDSIEMDHMVRFAHSATSGIPIGFHGIPTRSGQPMQTEDDLGGFRSAGCVRQSDADAVFLYDWTPVGTTVVVLH